EITKEVENIRSTDTHLTERHAFIEGKALFQIKEDGSIAFAETKLDKLPDNWVIRRDVTHPKWKEIEEYLYHKHGISSPRYYGEREGDGCTVECNNILYLKGCRLVSLDQFYNFVITNPKFVITKPKIVITKPKIGDWGKFWDYNIDKYIISELTKVYDENRFRYKAKNGVDFMYFKKIDINKPIKDII